MISRTILDTHNQNCPSTRAKRQRVVDREHVRLERVFTNYVLLAEEESVSVFSRRSQISRRDRGRPVASPPVIDSRWNARPRCCCFGQINEPLIRFPTVSLQVGKSQLAARMGSADWVETRVDWYDSFRVASPSFPLSLSLVLVKFSSFDVFHGFHDFLVKLWRRRLCCCKTGEIDKRSEPRRLRESTRFARLAGLTRSRT